MSATMIARELASGHGDRMLFQAERLKTLRAMSVAVIHEISQPLSTLAIEAKHLHEIEELVVRKGLELVGVQWMRGVGDGWEEGKDEL